MSKIITARNSSIVSLVLGQDYDDKCVECLSNFQ